MYRPPFQDGVAARYFAGMDPARPTASDILKGELKRRRITQAELAERLGQPAKTVINKLDRGHYDVEWFLAALRAIGVSDIRID
jgi:DNA-binding XRE family transcriptional regulator